MEGNHAIWKDFLPRTWISYHIPGFPTTYLFFLPHTLVGLDVAVQEDWKKAQIGVTPVVPICTTLGVCNTGVCNIVAHEIYLSATPSRLGKSPHPGGWVAPPWGPNCWVLV